MGRVINPAELIERYLINQGALSERKDSMHQCIISGAAILLNDLNSNILPNNFCWSENVTKKGFTQVVLEAVTQVEEKLCCFDESEKSNRQQIFETWKRMLDEEENGMPIISIL